MKKRIFKFSLFLSIFLVVILSGLYIRNSHSKKLEENVVIDIEEILKSSNYSYLPEEAKDYIRDFYNETGVVLLTEKNYEGEEAYLNPSFVEYLTSEDKTSYNIIPSVTTYIPNIAGTDTDLPESFDLRDVNGKNFVTPIKDQGNEGLCWAFASSSLLETHDLIAKNKSYDSSATLYSEKQFDYALSKDGFLFENTVVTNANRNLTTGSALSSTGRLLLERIGGFENSWEITNAAKVKNNELLTPDIVFDRSNSTYEVDNTVMLSNINKTDGQALTEDLKNYIKSLIYNNGGTLVTINVASNHMTRNIENENDFLSINNPLYTDVQIGNHALHLIGWDDNYEYSFCRNYLTDINLIILTYQVKIVDGERVCDSFNDPDVESTLVTGRGSWILKNSWGNNYSIVHVPYDSIIDEIIAFTTYSEKSWDNSYFLNKNYNDSTFAVNDNNYVGNETIDKIKVDLYNPTSFTLYYSEDGSDNYVSLGDYSYDTAGYKTIDLSDRNISVNNNSKFKVGNTAMWNMFLFTDNNESSIGGYTFDYIYGAEDEKPLGSQLNMHIITRLKNVDDGTVVNYKIRNSNNEYIPDSAYSIQLNKSYYNEVTPIITLDSEYSKKGVYTLETWVNNVMVCTSLINIEKDFMPINGSGTYEDPWQITNVRQFNWIRNARYDAFILMNDLDFEYDTTDPDGLFYINGNKWESIVTFYGNLDGNGKTIRNFHSTSPIFSYVYANDDCRLEKCGVHDLNIDSSEFKHASSAIMKGIIYSNYYKGEFSNLSVTNTTIGDCYYDGGAIAETIRISDNSDWTYTILKIENWYSDVTYTNSVFHIGRSETYMGGLIGGINMTGGQSQLYLSNLKAVSHYQLENEHNAHTYYLSDVIGKISLSYSTLVMNNIIGFGSYEFDPNSITVETNGLINNLENSNGTFTVFNAKLGWDYNISSGVDISNYEDSLEPYEIARADYSNYSYYDSEYYVTPEERDNGTLVSFEDKFDHIENKIPTLKQFNEEYAEYEDTYYVGVNETVDINNLISNDSNHKDYHVYSSFTCNLDLCNSVTDDTIITIPTEDNDYKFTGLKLGSTKLIIYDKTSGYLNTVNIEVIDNSYRLILDYNYDDIIDDSLIVISGRQYGNLPVLTRREYNFLGWFTDKNGGTKIESDTIFEGNADITLYAHWERKNDADINYYVTFDPNGGTGSMEQQTYNINDNKALSLNTFEKTSYEFDHWNTKDDDTGTRYEDGQVINIKEDITLYAFYHIIIYTVTFDTTGGESLPPLTVPAGSTISAPTPVREGYVFGSWWTDPDNTNLFFGTVNDNITLYARWFQIEFGFNPNGAEITSEFNVPNEIPAGEIIELKSPEEYGVITPDGKVFDAYQIAGARYYVGQKFEIPVTDAVYITCLWKPEDRNYTEYYEISFRQLFDSTIKTAYNENLEDAINKGKEESLAVLNNFIDGKENVTVDDYGELVDGDTIKKFRSYRLLATEIDDNNNTIVYRYELMYILMKYEVGSVRNDIYTLNKTDEVSIPLDDSIDDIEELVNNKKNELSSMVKDVSIDNLYVIDKDNDYYQYAEFVDYDIPSSEYDSTNNVYIYNYNVNYKLVKVNKPGEEKYTLTNTDNVIEFIDMENQQFEFTIENIINSEEDNEIKRRSSKRKY